MVSSLFCWREYDTPELEKSQYMCPSAQKGGRVAQAALWILDPTTPSGASSRPPAHAAEDRRGNSRIGSRSPAARAACGRPDARPSGCGTVQDRSGPPVRV